MKIKLPQINNLDDLSTTLDIPKKYITYYLYKYPLDKRYKVFKIPKKKGGYREIAAPANNLKLIQQKLNEILTNYYENFIASQVHGFCHNRSIVTNAKHHLRKKYVLNIDLKDFFPSIHFGRVNGLFRSEPFNFNDKISNILANICCHEGVLPQGSPTSPIITNFICKKLDKELQHLAKRNNCKYTRYADDITISSNDDIFPDEIALLKRDNSESFSKFKNLYPRINEIIKIKDINYIYDEEGEKDLIDITFENILDKSKQRKIKELIFTNGAKVSFLTENKIELKSNNANPEVLLSKALTKIIENNGFQINYNKVRISTRNYKQEVTGVKVNDNLNVERSYIRNIRAMLHCWDKEGIEKAESKVLEKKSTFAHPNKQSKNFRNILWGRIDFVGQVRGKDDKIYQNFLQKYEWLENDKKEMDPIKVLNNKIKNINNQVIQIKEFIDFNNEPHPMIQVVESYNKELYNQVKVYSIKMNNAKIKNDFFEFCRQFILHIELIFNFLVKQNIINVEFIVLYYEEFWKKIMNNLEPLEFKGYFIQNVSSLLFFLFYKNEEIIDDELKGNYYKVKNCYTFRNINSHGNITENWSKSINNINERNSCELLFNNPKKYELIESILEKLIKKLIEKI